jgi:hypothetical protein
MHLEVAYWKVEHSSQLGVNSINPMITNGKQQDRLGTIHLKKPLVIAIVK